jgi:hypothetical protein
MSKGEMMKRLPVGGALLAGSLSFLAATAPAGAQQTAQAPRPTPPTSQSAPYTSALPQYRGRPNQPRPYVRELPPEPLGPNSLGLLEREFQYMRRTAPYPDKFLYGRWNPRYEVVTPPVTQYPGGGGYYYPNVPYYGGYYYNGYPNPYGVGVYGYAPNRIPTTVVQQEVVVVQERARDLQQSGALKDAPRTPAPTRDERSGNKGQLEDFYLGGSKQNETISDALDDIRKAWLNGDVARLSARFKTEGKVRVYPRGEYKYTVEAKEFTSMLKDAMTKIDTVSFEFDRPKAEEAGRLLVTGAHTFVDADKEKRTTYVSYGLERTGGRWLITEAGSSAVPIAKHQD